jgi:hypothetical protein
MVRVRRLIKESRLKKEAIGAMLLRVVVRALSAARRA